MLNKSVSCATWQVASCSATDTTREEVLEFKTWSSCKFKIALYLVRITKIVSICGEKHCNFLHLNCIYKYVLHFTENLQEFELWEQKPRKLTLGRWAHLQSPKCSSPFLPWLWSMQWSLLLQVFRWSLAVGSSSPAAGCSPPSCTDHALRTRWSDVTDRREISEQTAQREVLNACGSLSWNLHKSRDKHWRGRRCWKSHRAWKAEEETETGAWVGWGGSSVGPRAIC